MAEEPESTSPAPAKKRLPKTLGIVLGVALLQGVVFFVMYKFVGSRPAPAHGEGSHVIAGEAASQPANLAEVVLLKGFKVPNDKSGRMWIYDIDISVVVPEDQREKMQQLAEDRAGEIGDRVARIMRGATEQMLREDDLRALRVQLTEVLAEVTGDRSLIRRVLIPRLVPIPSQ